MSEQAFLIHHENFSGRDRALIFGEDIEVTVLPRDQHPTMLDVLVHAGIFPSKGQARKNWKGEVEIPMGFTQITAGKLRTLISIHNPPDDLPPDPWWGADA